MVEPTTTPTTTTATDDAEPLEDDGNDRINPCEAGGTGTEQSDELNRNGKLCAAVDAPSACSICLEPLLEFQADDGDDDDLSLIHI